MADVRKMSAEQYEAALKDTDLGSAARSFAGMLFAVFCGQKGNSGQEL